MVQLLTCEMPDFIAPTPWPANSHDLNPVDYKICRKLKECVYCSQIHEVAKLKLHLIEEWGYFNQMINWSSEEMTFTSSSLCSSAWRIFWLMHFDSRMCKRCHSGHFMFSGDLAKLAVIFGKVSGYCGPGRSAFRAVPHATPIAAHSWKRRLNCEQRYKPSTVYCANYRS